MTDAERPSSRLPRIKHAQKPRPDEKIRKRSGADLQNGWMGRHGTLYLTDERIVFVPTLIDTALGAKRREISLDTLREVERFPKNPDDLALAGKRPRLLMVAPECVYELVVPDLDSWIDSIEVVYNIRNKRGQAHRATIIREGVENLLLAEE
ncbi:MAG: hypothetical protein U0237_12335 [Thermoleophilia bacterium]